MAMDPELRKMMIAVLVALIAVLIVGFTIVELTMRHFAE
jgi:hypothetical protein